MLKDTKPLFELIGFKVKDFEDLKTFLVDYYDCKDINVLVTVERAIRKTMTASERVNIVTDAVEIVTETIGHKQLSSSQRSAYRRMLTDISEPVSQILITCVTKQTEQELEISVRVYTQVRTGETTDDHELINCCMFRLSLLPALSFKEATTLEQNVVKINVEGFPNSGRTYVAMLIRKALLGAGIKNVDVSNCGHDILQLSEKEIPAFVIESINERGITYVISDNVKQS